MRSFHRLKSSEFKPGKPSCRTFKHFIELDCISNISWAYMETFEPSKTSF